ncbi:MAG: FkbM family methyltransferase [Nitrosotalea sp.]
MKSKYPIIGILKKGDRILLNNFYHVNFIAKAEHTKEIKYDLDNDVVDLTNSPFSHLSVKLNDAIDNGDVIGVYLEEIYRDLPVKDNIVIDIGANIGDSSIYFALKGSKRVIALEPFPKNYEMAKKNIELNNVSDKIDLFLAGCSDGNDFLIVDPNLNSGVDSKIIESKNGLQIPITTLNKIVKDYKVDKNSILKIDCEGCEYDVILSASFETLQSFSNIFIEYHYGYKDLKKKLEESGFQVSVTKPSISGQLPLILHNLKKTRKTNTMDVRSIEHGDDSSHHNDNMPYRLTCVGQIHAVQI